MIIIRPITKKDQNIFVEFSFDATLGIRNLPRNRDKLQEKILKSESSFAKEVKEPGKEEYFFVLEDITTGRIGGTCGILATVNFHNNYCYHIETIHTNTRYQFANKEMQVLRVVTSGKGCSEVCSLYLQPTFRHSGQGRLLSLSRFLFIAAHRQRFEKKIIAEMRGYIDQRQISPFWDAVGRHFCNLSFVELMTQLDMDNISISEILPQYPIYVSLLPKNVQDIIGKTHEGTKPALAMLIGEGFQVKSEIDVLEAGPTLEAPTSSIRAIKSSKTITIDTTDDLLADESEFILSNDRLDFRACYGNLQFVSKNHGLINKNVAEALLIQPGNFIRYVTLH
jgi:arginine N-succinyltransferase